MKLKHTLFLAFLVLPFCLFARDAKEAGEVAGRWAGRAAPFARRAVGGVKSVRTAKDPASGAEMHVVKYENGGVAVVSAQDADEPVVAFLPDAAELSEDPENPLWVLLCRDAQVRAAAAKDGALLAKARQAAGGAATIDDVRVGALVQSKWNQRYDDTEWSPLDDYRYVASGANCFNYYTPNHYVCGCVATAGAQIMRYHQWPTAAVTPATYDCMVDGVTTPLTMQGGTYNWASMPLEPVERNSNTEAERQAIGKLTSDVGIAVQMNYTANGSAAYSGCLADRFVSRFGYANAKAIQIGQIGFTVENLKRMVVPNFDAGYPVVIGVSGSGYGHAVVGDGYGYSDNDFYVHLNVGYGGSNDAWYCPPNTPINGTEYDTFDVVVFNVMPDKTGSIASGRVLNAGGTPAANATVTVKNASNATVANVTTGASGIWSFVAPAGTYTVSASGASGKVADTSVTLVDCVSTAYVDSIGCVYSLSPAPVIGNSFGNDITLADPPPPPVYTDPAITMGTPSVNGTTVNIGGSITDLGGAPSAGVSILWGETQNLEQTPVLIGWYTSTGWVNKNLENLARGKTYYAALKIENSAGYTVTETKSFYVGYPPEGVIGGATVNGTSVYVNGCVNSCDGVNWQALILWGETTELEQTPVEIGWYSGTGWVGRNIENVTPGRFYYAAVKFHSVYGDSVTAMKKFYVGPTQVWRPQSEFDNWASSVWAPGSGTGSALGDPGAFLSATPTYFDGQETAVPFTVSIPGAVATPYLEVGGARDYMFTGAAVSASEVVKTGTGSWTVSNAGIGSPDAIKVEGGLMKLGGGTHTTVANLYVGVDIDPQSARLSITNGASVKVTGELTIGKDDYTGTGRSYELSVDGGALDADGLVVNVGDKGRGAKLVLNSGSLTCDGINVQKLWDSEPLRHTDATHEVFAMNGGTLSLGEEGIDTTRGLPLRPTVWFGGGTLESRDATAWRFKHSYMNPTFETWGAFSGPAVDDGNLFTLDTGNAPVVFNTVIQGNGNVRLTGSADFIADDKVKGGVNGRWTVDNTGSNNLCNVAGFGRGLEVKSGSTAVVEIGDPEGFASLSAFCNCDGLVHDGYYIFPGADPNLASFAGSSAVVPTWYSDISSLLMKPDVAIYTNFRIEGEFLVEDAGTYTFAGVYDDKIALSVDGGAVFETSAYNVPVCGSVALSAGWHKFKIVFEQQAGGSGPNGAWKTAGMALGWHFGEISSTDPADYAPFDGASFKIRPNTTVRLTRNLLGQNTDTAAWTNEVYTETITLESMQSLHDTAWTLGKNAVNEFSGWFNVGTNMVGDWTFSGRYDDHLQVKIDGDVVLKNESWQYDAAATIAIDEPGWHSFQVRVFDFGGGIARSGAPVLSYSINGGTAVPFDERSLEITAAPFGRIGGEFTVEEDARVVNVAKTACAVTGTLAGSGTLDGKFKLDGATLRLTGGESTRQLAGVEFVNADPNALANLGTVEVAFNGSVERTHYLVGPARGFTTDTAEDKARVSATLTVGSVTEPYEHVSLEVIDGMLYVVNGRPAGTIMLFR